MILDRQRNADVKISLVHYRRSPHRDNPNLCRMSKEWVEKAYERRVKPSRRKRMDFPRRQFSALLSGHGREFRPVA